MTIGLARLLGASPLTLLALAPRSTTTAVSVEIARLIHALVPLTAVATVITGILGATFGTSLLAWLCVRDPRAIGLAMGTGSLALGAARSLAISETAAAFAAFGLVANALLLVAGLPLLCRVAAARRWLP